MTRIGLIGVEKFTNKPNSRMADIARQYPDLDLRAYPSWVPIAPSTPVEFAMQVLGYTDAALTAAEDGCDALVIDNIGDYGLEAIRASVAIPVHGPGELGVKAASRTGRQFGIVTILPESMNFVLIERLRSAQCSELCIGIANVYEEHNLEKLVGSENYLQQVREDQNSIIEKLVIASAKLEANGAQAVMLGSTYMFEYAPTIAASMQIPFINPFAIAMVVAREAKPRTQTLRLHPLRARLLRAMVDSIAHEQVEK